MVVEDMETVGALDGGVGPGIVKSNELQLHLVKVAVVANPDFEFGRSVPLKIGHVRDGEVDPNLGNQIVRYAGIKTFPIHPYRNRCNLPHHHG